MSNLSDSSSSTSESESESSFLDEVVRKLAEFTPYDDSVEPLATKEEEAVAYNTQVRREEEEELQFQQRFSQEVAVN